ncbi:DUF368 domain-containing protein [Sporohalobacter salinus]|uniref:DUF368 domain-containing protein n=1 Tax=Sporohalobacter salinus TaxID=1494606 RepID=UPI0019604291|nr:DUF368 domain-containing protein [Sporohalobacter salinus]MBM7623813.1 putative membrane protein [Sporohalobacter salinus]
MNKFLKLFIKGIPIGISNTLPGVSGGTMALVLDIYDDLISGIKKIRLSIVGPIFFGAMIGVLGSSKIITSLLESYPNLIKAFLLGLIFASSKVTFKQVKKINLKTISLCLVGLLLALMYSVELDSVTKAGALSYFKIFFGGVIGSVAMILPGVSGGTVLIMLGLYEGVLEAITTFNLSVIAIFGLGVGSGLLIFSQILFFLLNNFRSLLMAFLTGLILGSMRSVISFQLGIGVVISFILGVIIIQLLSE